MIKNLRFVLMSLLVLVCGTAMADEVTIDASDIQAAVTEATTVDGITFLAEKADGATAPAYNERNGDLRIYAKGTLTITAETPITQLVFNISTQGLRRLAPITASTGTIAEQASGDQNVTWTGSATEIVLTVGEKADFGTESTKAGQFDFVSVVVTTDDGDAPVVVKTANPIITPNGGEFEESIVVTLDHEDEEASIFYTLNTEDWNQAIEAEPGTKLTLTETTVLRARAFDYENDWSDVVTVTFTKKETPQTQVLTVGEALEIIEALADGATTDETYQVKGYVVAIAEISTSYGNATFDIAESTDDDITLTIYRVKGFNGDNITNENIVKVGDEVVVEGKLQKYVKGENVTPELARNGKIISVNGKTEDEGEDTPKSYGTPGSPISVAEALDIIAGLADGATTGLCFVGGYVCEISEISTQFGNATFTIGDQTGSENVLTAFRTKGLQSEDIKTDDYVKVGNEVVLCGKLQRYVKDGVVTPEIAGAYIFSLNGETTVAIEAVETQQAGAGVIFNLAGQRVKQAQKGLYIVGGRKVVLK